MGLFDLPIISDISDLFGGGNAGENEMQQRLKAWQQLRDQANVPYTTPENTFGQQKEGLERFNQQSQTGLTDADKYAFWAARQQAGDFANQGQGAAQQQAAMQGGGVANSGQNAVMQAQAAQQGANRLQGADMGQAAAATQRRYQATRDYMTGLQGLGNQQFRNATALNQFNQQNFGNQMGATGGMSGAYKDMANWQQDQQYNRRKAGKNLVGYAANAFGGISPTGGGYSGESMPGGGSYGITG
jgi:hypothetical protein